MTFKRLFILLVIIAFSVDLPALKAWAPAPGGRPVAVLAGSSSATGPANCGRCAHNLGTNEHWFTSQCEAGDDCYNCVEFNSCHSNLQNPYSCNMYHWLCSDTQSALSEIDQLVAATDINGAMTEVSNRLPFHVDITPDGYLLVFGCDGMVAAAFSRADLVALHEFRLGWVLATRARAEQIQLRKVQARSSFLHWDAGMAGGTRHT